MSKKDEVFRRYEKLARAAKKEKPGSASDHKPGSCAHCLYYLSIHATDNGWDYSIYDKSFAEVDGGWIDLASITIQECRDMILQDLGWQNKNFAEMDYDMVEERAADAAEEKLNSVLEQLHEKRMANGDRASDADARPKPIAEKKKSEECL